MKVLHLSAGNLYGGLETFLTTMARLREMSPEMEPEFGLCFHGRLWDDLVATGVPVHDFGPVRLSRPWTVWRALAAAPGLGRHPRRGGGRPFLLAAYGVRARGAAGRRPAGPPVPWGDDRPTLARAVVCPNCSGLVLANSRFTAGSVGKVFPGTQVEVWHLPVPRPAIEGPGGPKCGPNSALRIGGGDTTGEPTGAMERPGGPPERLGAHAGHTRVGMLASGRRAEGGRVKIHGRVAVGRESSWNREPGAIPGPAD